ncbi:hypothetical protein LRP30_25370 [Bradyrhizobium sp. C-145]|uniref:hypothetical protein n=1 Tax=Bradyrhizobium sp. C-145 TaxID=574727 RepID=UPI00201B867E|nr:hypothetical protein [Bradyrhizobium sp. C-145]UQR60331.1 hypothetical protein LRP30_25370 [Bradyrhizobium sp. C-145]
MRSTTLKEKARIAAGAVTAIVMTAVLFAIAMVSARAIDGIGTAGMRRRPSSPGAHGPPEFSDFTIQLVAIAWPRWADL